MGTNENMGLGPNTTPVATGDFALMFERFEVVFEYGRTWEFSELPEFSIALDGAVQGPAIDNENQKFSFDHHADCVRTFTLATCQQVLVSMDLGFAPKPNDRWGIYLNDMDADTLLSAWLLLYPQQINDRVRSLVEKVGYVDSHGPVTEVHPLHWVLSPNPRTTEQGLQWFRDGMEAITEYARGKDPEPPTPRPPVDFVGWDSEGVEFEGAGSFVEAYRMGAVVALMLVPGADDSVGYTLAKKSEFVQFDMEAFKASMNEMEPGWGGPSTMAGAPRQKGGVRSRLVPWRVADAVRAQTWKWSNVAYVRSMSRSDATKAMKEAGIDTNLLTSEEFWEAAKGVELDLCAYCGRDTLGMRLGPWHCGHCGAA